VHELSNRALGESHCRRNLGPAAAVNGGLEQCVVLTRRKLCYLGQGVTGKHPALGDLLRGLSGWPGLVQFGHGRP
jgi:hypothetical protein